MDKRQRQDRTKQQEQRPNKQTGSRQEASQSVEGRQTAMQGAKQNMQPSAMQRGGGGQGLPDPAVLAAMVGQRQQGQQMGAGTTPTAMGMSAVSGQDVTGLQPAEGEQYQHQGSRITTEMLKKATLTMHKYRAGKASLERRIIEAQEWWKLKNWEQINERKGVQGYDPGKSSTAWLWNCIVGKHADAMDSYPEPAILPRMRDDKAEAAKLNAIVPVVLKINGFEQVYSDVAWQKMLEGTGAYGVYWDKNKLNGLGDISIRKVNLLNLYWEPGIGDIQDSKNVFHVALMDNETLVQMYPQLEGQTLSSASTVSKYRYDDSISTADKSLVVDWYYHVYEGNRKILHYVKFVGEHVLYATVDDPACAQRGLYDDGQYPFVLDPLFPVEGSPCGFGYIHVGKDTQKDIDLISQAVVANATVNATPRWFIRQDGGVNETEAADMTKPFIHYTGAMNGDNLIPVTNPTLPTNVVEVLQMKIEELKFVTGNVDVNNGGTPSGVTAASAIAALKEDAGRSSKDSNKAAYRAYAQIVTMVIERIRQFYDMPRQFRILGADGAEYFVDGYTNQGIVPQHQGIDAGVDMGYRLPAFDIDVRAQRETSYTKAAQNELGIQLFQLGVFNPQLADQSAMLLDMMDFKGKEELLQKVRQMGTMATALQQIGQIAAQMAMQLGDQQSAAMIQQIAMTAAGGGAVGMQGMGQFDMPEADAQADESDANKHPFVKKAEQQSEEATRPQ